MDRIRSALGVAIGFAVFVIGSFMPRGATEGGTPLTTGFVVGAVAYGAIFAALGGLTAASIAGRKQLQHGRWWRRSSWSPRSSTLARDADQPPLAGPLRSVPGWRPSPCSAGGRAGGCSPAEPGRLHQRAQTDERDRQVEQ
jgi:hypothetical protein